MKKNKKAIFGLAIAMIFSLAFMQGMSTKSNDDMTIQQIGLACAVTSSFCEDGGAWDEGLSYVAKGSLAISSGLAVFGEKASLASHGAVDVPNPVTTAYVVTTVVIGL